MSDDIEKFLKRAAQRRRSRSAKPPPRRALRPEPVQDVEIVEADIRDDAGTAAQARRASIVVHLAAFGSVGDSVENP